MPDERSCPACGRLNPVSQPRCIGCGHRAAGTVLVQEAPTHAPTTRWWEASTGTGGSNIPLPPQIKAEAERVEQEKRAEEERKAEQARRRAETERKAAEAKAQVAARQAAARAMAQAAAVETARKKTEAQNQSAGQALEHVATTATTSCLRCGTPTEPGFSFCLRCGADMPVSAARPVSAAAPGTIAAMAGAMNNEAVETASRVGATRSTLATPGVTLAQAQMAPTRATSPGLTATLSFMLPGVGQIMNKQVSKGILLLLTTFAALAVLGMESMGFLMLVVRAVAALDAYRVSRRRNAGESIREGEWDLG